MMGAPVAGEAAHYHSVCIKQGDIEEKTGGCVAFFNTLRCVERGGMCFSNLCAENPVNLAPKIRKNRARTFLFWRINFKQMAPE